MAKLKPLLDSIDGLTPAVADYYVKNADGKWQLDVDGSDGYTLERAAPLRDALSKERAAREKTAAKLRTYGWTVDDDGKLTESSDGAIDPAHARKLASKWADGKFTSPDDVKAIEDQFKANHATYVQSVEAERKQDMDDFRQHYVTRSARAAIRASGGKDNTETFLLPIIEQRTHLKRVNGRLRAVVTDEQGRELLSKKPGSTDPMGVEELVQGLRSDPLFATAWPGKATGGSGSDHVSGGSANAAVDIDPSRMTAKQLLQAAHKGF